MTAARADDPAGRIARIVDGIDRLPALPSIVNKLLQVLSSPESSADDAAGLLEKDPALTGRILRLANSAFYGMPRSVSSVGSAVVILGFNTIRSVAFGSTLTGMFPSDRSEKLFSREAFWRHSVLCATVARAIVRRNMAEVMVDPESVFCGGILHDVGKLVFDEFCGEEYHRVCLAARDKELPLAYAEKRVFGVSHDELGRYLADKWALPLDLESAMVYHHCPAQSRHVPAIAAAIHCADRAVHEREGGIWPKEAAPPFVEEAPLLCGMKENEVDALDGMVTDARGRIDEYLAVISS